MTTTTTSSTRRAKSAPSLRTIVRRALAGEAAPPDGTTELLVAVSGGPDSMALLDVLARIGPGAGIAVRAHGVDHGLRPDAGRELDLAEGLARQRGVPFDRTRVVVTPGGNLQARARAARWGALAAAARARGAAIATAHHADDRAETLVMRLLRGSGARGLAVLPARSSAPNDEAVTVLRPLLRARRAEIMAHLERQQVSYANDPSNRDPRYLRTRVRERLMPLLAELDPNIVDHLASLADELIDRMPPNGARAGRSPEDTLSWVRALPRPTQSALADLVRSRSPGARVWLPGGLVVAVAPDVRQTPASRPGRAVRQPRLPAGKPRG